MRTHAYGINHFVNAFGAENVPRHILCSRKNITKVDRALALESDKSGSLLYIYIAKTT